MRRTICYALFALLLANRPLFAQNEMKGNLRNIYLLGNTANIAANDPILNGLEALISKDNCPSSILYLGDILDENGMDTLGEHMGAVEEKLIRLGQIASINPAANALFIPGDRDWDGSGMAGWENIKHLEAFFSRNAIGQMAWLANNGCPGPVVTDLGDDLRIIAINTQWFVHPFDKPRESDALCDMYNLGEFWEELDDFIEKAPHRNIIIAAHHPIYSYGQYAGYKNLRQHLFPLTDLHEKLFLPLPVLGSFYASFRQNVGVPQDLTHPQMEEAYTKRMRQLLQKHRNVIYASGHELDLQALLINGNFHINSGTAAQGKPVAKGEGTFFKSSERGFVKLEYQTDGTVSMKVFSLRNGQTGLVYEQQLMAGKYSTTPGPVNDRFALGNDQTVLAKHEKPTKLPSHVKSVPSNRYQASDNWRLVFGEHYRNTWATPVTVPVLNIDTAFGGLVPTNVGGGGQSKVLKLTAANGQTYNFRSVDKDPTQSTSTQQELLNGWYGRILRDMVSGQYPYGAIVADKLMDATGIYHVKPQLYVMPDHPNLGEYRKAFAGMLGILELRPKGKNKEGEGFQGAAKVVKTVRLFRYLIEDKDHHVDAPAYAKARLFDLLVADWDRTPDNWRFIAFGDKKAFTFYPMPKDRDRAFHKWEGIYRLADQEFGSLDIAHFGRNYGDFKSLTHKGRNIDRMLLNELTWEQWEKIATELKDELTDEVIAEAVASVPAEARAEAQKLIAETLKTRRDKLMEAAFKFYRLLAKHVNVIGSNKAEVFEVRHLPTGDVEVAVFKKKKIGEKGNLRYYRLLLKAETKEIRLYGLAGADEFRVEGDATHSIPIRIIPGDGNDLVVDESKTRKFFPKNKLYNQPGEDSLFLSANTKQVEAKDEVAFTSDLYYPDIYLPIPSFIYNKDDSLGAGLGLKVVRQGFNKPGYASKYYFRAAGTTRHSFWLNATADFRHVVGKWDMVMGGKATNVDRSMRHFYGIGNETQKDSLLYKIGFYENRTKSTQLSLGLRRTFWQRSHFTVATLSERYLVTNDTSSIQLTDVIGSEAGPLRGMGKSSYLGTLFDLDLDLTDAKNMPNKGVRLQFNHRYFFNLSEKDSRFGRFNADLRFYETIRMKKPLTIGLRGGYEQAYGTVPFYYLATLGQGDNLRGFVRNRFAGEKAAYANFDLRLHLGTVKTSVIPFGVGLVGFADMGRVWSKGQNSHAWHQSCGGGFYLSPINDNFNLIFNFATSKEEKLMFDLTFGISL